MLNQAVRALPIVMILLAGSIGTGRCASPVPAQKSADYTVSDDEGYGIADCMRSGSACGRAMADSWCEAHGHARALAFGSGEDVTGSVVGDKLVKVAAGDVVIRCGD